MKEGCAICLNEKNELSVLGKLPCDHSFCYDCIETWQLKQEVVFCTPPTCPMCCKEFKYIDKIFPKDQKPKHKKKKKAKKVLVVLQQDDVPQPVVSPPDVPPPVIPNILDSLCMGFQVLYVLNMLAMYWNWSYKPFKIAFISLTAIGYISNRVRNRFFG